MEDERDEIAENLQDLAHKGDALHLSLVLESERAKAAIDHLHAGWTALMQACHDGQGECARILIEAGAQVDAQDIGGDGALHWAVRRGDYTCAKILLDTGADVNLRSYDGSVPLRVSARHAGCDIAYLLIERGADVNAVDNTGVSCLLAAIRSGSTLGGLLLQRGARTGEDWSEVCDSDEHTRARDRLIEELGGADAVQQTYREWLATRPGMRTKSAVKT